jgi:hypothetical protein
MGPGKAIARPEQQVIAQKRKTARRGFDAELIAHPKAHRAKENTRPKGPRVFETF